MSEPTIRALALDIDGTLIGSDKRVPAFTRSEIARVAEEYGAHVFLVTARPPSSARLIAQELGASVSYATFSGALVEARGAGTSTGTDGAYGDSLATLRAVAIPAPTVARAGECAADLPVHVGVYGRDTWAVSDMGHWGLREARGTGVWPTDVGRPAVERAIGENETFKIMFRGEAEPLNELERRLVPLADEMFVHRSGNVLECTSVHARKFSAVEALCAHFGIGTDQVLAFGDTTADREMLESVGAGVLMGNAQPGTATGVEVTLSNDEDGVGMMLRRDFPTARPFDPWSLGFGERSSQPQRVDSGA
ncbi:HAD-IIB family hydrolase [Leucobacter sp. gxy201]|uniref:HAD-IIB family hydrolase n=1 Tax=Leucobacter sp. gxy201 TaxID=2957200 RepID=UPI003DA06F5B